MTNLSQKWRFKSQKQECLSNDQLHVLIFKTQSHFHYDWIKRIYWHYVQTFWGGRSFGSTDSIIVLYHKRQVTVCVKVNYNSKLWPRNLSYLEHKKLSYNSNHLLFSSTSVHKVKATLICWNVDSPTNIAGIHTKWTKYHLWKVVANTVIILHQVTTFTWLWMSI